MSEIISQPTAEIDITEKRPCSKCAKEFPKSNLYFNAQGSGFAKICHECDYSKKVAEGKNPTKIAENGKPKSEWKPTVQQIQEKKPSPWMSSPGASSSVPVSSSFSVSSSSSQSTPSESASSSSTHPTKSNRSSRYNPEVYLKKDDKGGGVTLYIRDYLKIDEQSDGNIQVVKKPRPSPAPSPSASSSADPQPDIPDDLEFCDEAPFDEEEEEREPSYISARDQIVRLIEIFPGTAEKLGLTFEIVEQLSDEEAESKLEIFMSLSDMGSNFNIFKTALCSVTNVLEGLSRQPRISNYVDLTGLTQDIAQDPQIDSLLKEVVDQYRDEIAENMSPEVKLLTVIGIKSLEISFSNKRRKQCQALGVPSPQ